MTETSKKIENYTPGWPLWRGGFDVESSSSDGSASTHVNVRECLGEADWRSLPKRVRRRFHADTHDLSLGFDGAMEIVWCSRAGWLFAQAARLIGSPVVALNSRNVRCTVRLYPDPHLGGTVWERVYRHRGRQIVARTTKRTVDGGQPVESFCGFAGMALDIFERDGALWFVADRYFLQFGKTRILLPRWMSPGRLSIEHRDIGNGRFRFVMRVVHPVLGLLFFQDGVFRDPEELS